MEQKIVLILFIKISSIILLTWIRHFKHDLNSFNMYLDKTCIVSGGLIERTYRLLANGVQQMYQDITMLKEEVPDNGVNEKECIYNNEKGITSMNKQSKRSSSENVRSNNKSANIKTCVFETKKYSHLEKKIFKELDYADFLKKNRTVNDKIYKKIICKKYGLRIALPLLWFLFFLIVFLAELTLGLSGKECLLSYVGLKKNHLDELVKDTGGPLLSFVNALKKLTGFWEHSKVFGSKEACGFCKELAEGTISNACILGRFFRILICFVPFVILGVTIISGIIYYHKKVKMYEKIKFRKR
ncbi:hypothetical protein MKS88_005229 [Plasmodium brasilianum]|uniref:Uncharacterized protein n=1 Tax=Plasmodium brasilianum TaxID=5824 RepID=A0ACB9Y4W2_PLABR|nr:hypothetical protein MKS88_005229 [Plasmodium brasilianum]